MAVPAAANSEPLIRNDAVMRYRPFGRTGWDVSALSFGCMRLSSDMDLNTRLIARSVELGVNYYETTRFYCGGQCQHRTAPGLKDKSRGVIVSGKCGLGPDSTAFGVRQEIERQLEILNLSHFKFYQVGWFSWGMFPHLIKRGGGLDGLREAQDCGLIQRIGFTGHDSPENFTKCIETGVFDSLTIPYSLLNRMYEPTIRRAGELGVGVVAMCPVAGGVLSGESQAIRAALNMELPTTEMALRFVLANPNVSTACSGMSNLAMLEENVRTVHAFDPAKDADFEKMCAGLDRLRATLGERFCTACRYCLPCPQKIDIPRYMELYRNWKCFGLDDSVKAALKGIPADQSAANCTECGICEDKCPNHLSIRAMLKELQGIA